MGAAAPVWGLAPPSTETHRAPLCSRYRARCRVYRRTRRPFQASELLLGDRQTQKQRVHTQPRDGKLSNVLRVPGKQERGWSPSWSEYGRKGSRGSFLGRVILTDEQEQLGKARGRDEGRRKSSRCKSRISNAGNGTRFPYRMGRLASSFMFDESSRG